MQSTTTYKIIVTSWVLWLLTLMTILFSGALLLHELLPKNITGSIFAAVGLIAFALFIQRFISRAVVQVNLTDHSISIKWLKQFIFTNRPDREIPFSEIESYKYQEDTNFDLFKLTLKDGTDIKLWHFTFTRRDDFNKLITDFSISTNHYNKQKPGKKRVSAIDNPQKETKIEREKTIFESPAAPFLAGFAILLLIVIPTILVFENPSDKSSNPFPALAGMAGGLFFLIHYFKYRKKTESIDRKQILNNNSSESKENFANAE